MSEYNCIAELVCNGTFTYCTLETKDKKQIFKYKNKMKLLEEMQRIGFTPVNGSHAFGKYSTTSFYLFTRKCKR
jgi:hypothetical protein